jgi:transposase
MPAKDVKAYVKRNKNDAADAEAICEAVRRPTMRFVQVKSAEQQSQLILHRTRDLLMRQRTQVINALRAHLGELGMTAAQGPAGLKELLAIIASSADERLPAEAHASLIVLAAEFQAMQTLIASIEKRIIAHHRLDEASKRLRSTPGIGLVGATAIAATVTDPRAFRSGRDLAAWIGLVPRQDSTGGKQKLGPISKQGDRYLRRILVVGAHAVLKLARQKPEKYPWLTQLRSRLWRWHLPTRWPASPGHCWSRAAPIGRVRLWRRLKGTGDGRKRSRMCVHELQGDDDVDAKRSRPSIGKPVWADAILERVLMSGTDQRITSRPAATAAASRPR